MQANLWKTLSWGWVRVHIPNLLCSRERKGQSVLKYCVCTHLHTLGLFPKARGEFVQILNVHLCKTQLKKRHPGFHWCSLNHECLFSVNRSSRSLVYVRIPSTVRPPTTFCSTGSCLKSTPSNCSPPTASSTTSVSFSPPHAEPPNPSIPDKPSWNTRPRYVTSGLKPEATQPVATRVQGTNEKVHVDVRFRLLHVYVWLRKFLRPF